MLGFSMCGEMSLQAPTKCTVPERQHLGQLPCRPIWVQGHAEEVHAALKRGCSQHELWLIRL